MSKVLTDNCEFIKKYDEKAASIYKDIKYYYLTVNEVARLRHMGIPEVKYLYKKAKDLVKNKDKAWMDGLSNRAKAALLMNRFDEFSGIYKAVMVDNQDLEALEKIGQKVALEIRGWVLNHS